LVGLEHRVLRGSILFKVTHCPAPPPPPQAQSEEAESSGNSIFYLSGFTGGSKLRISECFLKVKLPLALG
jgi:hypothetical protein